MIFTLCGEVGELAVTPEEELALGGNRPLEIAERVRYRSMDWEVADVSDRVLTLFGRGVLNRGLRVDVVRGLEPVQRLTPRILMRRLAMAGVACYRLPKEHLDATALANALSPVSSGASAPS